MKNDIGVQALDETLIGDKETRRSGVRVFENVTRRVKEQSGK